MKKICLLAATAVLLLSGCATDLRSPDAIFASEDGVKVNFTAVIDETTGDAMSGKTRATGTSWDVGDLIGITCGTTQQNIQYMYAGDGVFSATGGVAEEIWVLGTQTYPVAAYYPFSGDSGSIPQDLVVVDTNSDNQQTAASREQIDILFASTEVNASDPNVTLDFHHMMSRIRLTFQAASGYQLSPLQLYLIGLKTTGTFNMETGEILVDSVASEDIYYPSIDEDDNYVMEAIVLPQVLEETFYFQAGMNGAYYEVTFDLSELKAGVSYNYTIIADEYSDNPFVLTVTDETQITDWTNSDGGEITPDPDLAGTDASTSTDDWDIDTEVITPSRR